MSRLSTLNQYIENKSGQWGIVTVLRQVSILFFSDAAGNVYIDLYRKDKINGYYLLEPIKEILECPDLVN